jgi:PTH1 family peptidyl-tRNA hydrolase
MVVLARPLAFMNRSGGVAERVLADLEMEPRNMLVVVDDIDLPLGAIRLRARGGPGTHNGLRDICRAVGTDFPRLRVGIRGSEVSHDLADYVTGPFAAEEREVAAAAIERAADAVESVLRVGVERAMNTVNRRQ